MSSVMRVPSCCLAASGWLRTWVRRHSSAAARAADREPLAAGAGSGGTRRRRLFLDLLDLVDGCRLGHRRPFGQVDPPGRSREQAVELLADVGEVGQQVDASALELGQLTAGALGEL